MSGSPTNGASVRSGGMGASSLRVLVVDDDTLNQRLGQRMVEMLGHLAEVAGNGADALVAMRERRFDVVLMDLQMPRMGGLEAARTFRSEQPPAENCRPWIIALTANADADIRGRCSAAGMNDFVSKPVSIDAVSAAMTRAAAGLAAARRSGAGLDT